MNVNEETIRNILGVELSEGEEISPEALEELTNGKGEENE